MASRWAIKRNDDPWHSEDNDPWKTSGHKLQETVESNQAPCMAEKLIAAVVRAGGSRQIVAAVASALARLDKGEDSRKLHENEEIKGVVRQSFRREAGIGEVCSTLRRAGFKELASTVSAKHRNRNIAAHPVSNLAEQVKDALDCALSGGEHTSESLGCSSRVDDWGKGTEWFSLEDSAEEGGTCHCELQSAFANMSAKMDVIEQRLNELTVAICKCPLVLSVVKIHGESSTTTTTTTNSDYDSNNDNKLDISDEIEKVSGVSPSGGQGSQAGKGQGRATDPGQGSLMGQFDPGTVAQLDPLLAEQPDPTEQVEAVKSEHTGMSELQITLSNLDGQYVEANGKLEEKMKETLQMIERCSREQGSLVALGQGRVDHGQGSLKGQLDPGPVAQLDSMIAKQPDSIERRQLNCN